MIPCLFSYHHITKLSPDGKILPFPKLICLRSSDCPCLGKLSMNFRYFSLQSTILRRTGTTMSRWHLAMHLGFGLYFKQVLQSLTQLNYPASSFYLDMEIQMYTTCEIFWSAVTWTQETFLEDVASILMKDTIVCFVRTMWKKLLSISFFIVLLLLVDGLLLGLPGQIQSTSFRD